MLRPRSEPGAGFGSDDDDGGSEEVCTAVERLHLANANIRYISYNDLYMIYISYNDLYMIYNVLSIFF